MNFAKLSRQCYMHRPDLTQLLTTVTGACYGYNKQTYPISALEEKTAERGVLKALVHSWNVHVGHNGGQGRVGELGNEQLEGQAALLCTSSVVPVQPQKSTFITLNHWSHGTLSVDRPWYTLAT